MGEQVSHTYGGRTKIYLFFHQRGPVDWHPVHMLLRTKTYLYLIRGDQLTGTGNLERFLVKVKRLLNQYKLWQPIKELVQTKTLSGLC